MGSAQTSENSLSYEDKGQRVALDLRSEQSFLAEKQIKIRYMTPARASEISLNYRENGRRFASGDLLNYGKEVRSRPTTFGEQAP